MIITNKYGIQFELEPAYDYASNGALKKTGSWFASIFKNNGSGTGIQFSSKKEAIEACYKWKG